MSLNWKRGCLIHYRLVVAIATNSINDSLDTFDVYTGNLIPGMLTTLMPILIKEINS